MRRLARRAPATLVAVLYRSKQVTSRRRAFVFTASKSWESVIRFHDVDAMSRRLEAMMLPLDRVAR